MSEHEDEAKASSFSSNDDDMSRTAPTETTPLLPDSPPPDLLKPLTDPSSDAETCAPPEGPSRAPGVYTTISILLLGVFLSQTDISFVIATYPTIASHFTSLSSSNWLITAYILAQSVAQPLYGQLSNIYGRKACLQASYILFAVGTAMSGLGGSMGMVVAGRAVQGCGGAGMVSLVNVVVVDLVPLREVAGLWSYVNVLQTVGRSCGGFLGGWLTQTLGWRWAFLIQIPPILLAILLVHLLLHLPSLHPQHQTPLTARQKLHLIDLPSALSLSLTILTFTFLLDTAGSKLPLTSPLLLSTVLLLALSTTTFYYTTTHTTHPIFPLHLLRNPAVLTNYALATLCTAAQLSLMLTIPLFFQATTHASPAAAGTYLIPAFVGNTLGALLTGAYISRTSAYRHPTLLAPLLALLCSALCLLRRGTHTSLLESCYTFLGGAATGMISSSAFVGMAAGIEKDDVAVAAGGMYLCFGVGTIAGASAGGSVWRMGVHRGLERVLAGEEGRGELVGRLEADVGVLWTLGREVRERVMPAYVEGFTGVMWLNMAVAGVAFCVALTTRQHRLRKA